MQALTTLTGAAAPLMEPNISTDVIVPSRQITSTSREGYGPKLFTPWRYLPDGNENPAFVLNQPAWRKARILIVGENFGCGSSREMAVWALYEFGIRCIIAPSFGAIFRENCLRNGLLPISLPKPQVQALAAQAADMPTPWTVDLTTCTLRTPVGQPHAFAIHEQERLRLLQGLDPIAATLQLTARIDHFIDRDRQERPWMWQRR